MESRRGSCIVDIALTDEVAHADELCRIPQDG